MYPDEVTWEEVGKYPVLASQLVGYSWQVGDGGYHVIAVEGDSMEPRINSGDKILVGDLHVSNGDLAVCLYKGRMLLRGITFERECTRLHAWNDRLYKDIVIPDAELDEFAILAKMLGIVPPLVIYPLSSMW